MTSALIIGRFQPFHRGHLRLIKEAAKEADHILIGIGSSQLSRTKDNPFTSEERRETIIASLKDMPGKLSLYDIPDIGNNDLWVAHVEKIVPKYDVVYTNGVLERSLFAKAGYQVHATGLFNRDKYSGTEIRRRIRSNEKWRHLVPEGTLKILKKIKGTETIKSLNNP